MTGWRVIFSQKGTLKRFVPKKVQKFGYKGWKIAILRKSALGRREKTSFGVFFDGMNGKIGYKTAKMVVLRKQQEGKMQIRVASRQMWCAMRLSDEPETKWETMRLGDEPEAKWEDHEAW